MLPLEELPALSVNQKVNVTVSISLGNEKPKPVHIWDPLTNNIKSGNTYEFQNLSVRHFQGITHLGTTPATIFKETKQKLETLNGPALLQNPEKEAKVHFFEMTNELNIFITCQSRKINEIYQV